jgi:hypothetical protein
VSSNLSVSHLGPRSSLGSVLLLNWLSRLLLGWLVALPLIEAVSQSGINALPQADRALFEAGGLWLVELAYREMHALSAGLRAGLWLTLAALALRTPVSALLFSASHDPKAALSVAFRRALGLFRRFLGLCVLELCGRGLAVALVMLLAYGLEALLPRPKNELLADWPTAVASLLCLLLLGVLSVFFECSRAFSAKESKLRLREVFASAAVSTRLHAFSWLGSGALYLGAVALLLAASGRLVEALDVGSAGAHRVLGVSLVHQAVLLALCLFQGAWVRRVLSLAQPGPDSPSALR